MLGAESTERKLLREVDTRQSRLPGAGGRPPVLAS